MKITVTGSLGYVSRPLVEKLVSKGHSVRVISSSKKKQEQIEALGAKAKIGDMEDAGFLTAAFQGAEAVYCMLASHADFTDPSNTAEVIFQEADQVARNYVEAIQKSGVGRVVYLSSIGADMADGTGLIHIHHNAEKTLGQLPNDVSLSVIRPAGFYKNFFAFIPAIKHTGGMAASYGGGDQVTWVSNLDIADAIVEELESGERGRRVRYVTSDVLTCNEAAAILGKAIGKPDLKWSVISNEQQYEIYNRFGMNDSIARQFVEMNASIHDGKLYVEYNRNKPILGKVKLVDFAKQFAAAYQQY